MRGRVQAEAGNGARVCAGRSVLKRLSGPVMYLLPLPFSKWPLAGLFPHLGLRSRSGFKHCDFGQVTSLF